MDKGLERMDKAGGGGGGGREERGVKWKEK